LGVLPLHTHEQAARAGTVELAEVDAAPAAQLQASAGNDERDRAARERALDVRRAVALQVLEGAVLGHDLAQRVEHVALHVRVGVLVDRHTGRGVGHEDVAETLDDPALAYRACNLRGHVDDLLPAPRLHL